MWARVPAWLSMPSSAMSPTEKPPRRCRFRSTILASIQVNAVLLFANRRHGADMAPIRLEHQFPQADGLAHGAGHRGALDVAAGHRRLRTDGGSAHGHHGRARQTLEPQFRHRVPEQHHIAVFIRDRRRSGAMAIDAEGRHLHFWKRPAHTVAVHDRQTGGGRGQHRFERVAPADFGRDQGVDLAAAEFLQALEHPQAFIAFGQLLDGHRRSADPADGEHLRVVVQLLDADQRDGAVRAAVPAGTSAWRCRDCRRRPCPGWLRRWPALRCRFGQCNARPQIPSSPTTLTRTRVAFPRRYASGTSSRSVTTIESASAPAAAALRRASSSASISAASRDI